MCINTLNSPRTFLLENEFHGVSCLDVIEPSKRDVCYKCYSKLSIEYDKYQIKKELTYLQSSKVSKIYSYFFYDRNITIEILIIN